MQAEAPSLPTSGLHDDAVELTILMPCLNEIETLEVCITKALSFLDSASIVGEVLIADNGSTDGSREVATSLGARVVPVETRGYGAALLGGIAAARGRYIIMGDADDSYDFTSLTPFVQRLRAGDDLVMGNRFQGGISPGAMPFLHRYLGNPVLSALGRLFFNIPVGDFHCGMRGFNTSVIRSLKLQTTGMEFASEMVVSSALADLRITEVPTTLRPDGRSRPPHLRTWRDGWRHFKFLLMYSPKWLYLYPGAALLAFGLVLSALLFNGPLHIGEHASLDLNSFTAACFAIIAGVQVITFGIIARNFASRTGMLPLGKRSSWMVRHIKTDRMVLVALALLTVGLFAFGAAFVQWIEADFGSLPGTKVTRTVIGGLTSVVVAVQLAFGAFLLDIIHIPRIARD